MQYTTEQWNRVHITEYVNGWLAQMHYTDEAISNEYWDRMDDILPGYWALEAKLADILELRNQPLTLRVLWEVVMFERKFATPEQLAVQDNVLPALVELTAWRAQLWTDTWPAFEEPTQFTNGNRKYLERNILQYIYEASHERSGMYWEHVAPSDEVIPGFHEFSWDVVRQMETAGKESPIQFLRILNYERRLQTREQLLVGDSLLADLLRLLSLRMPCP